MRCRVASALGVKLVDCCSMYTPERDERVYLF
jgi:hypothetical protein